MNYDEKLDLLLGGEMGFLPNDGVTYSLMTKKMYQDRPCECIFFYGISQGRASGPWRIILFDCESRTILEYITDFRGFFQKELYFECELEKTDMGMMLALMTEYKKAFDAVSSFAFRKQPDSSQKEIVGRLYELLKKITGNMYQAYQSVAPEFIGWMEEVLEK